LRSLRQGFLNTESYSKQTLWHAFGNTAEHSFGRQRKLDQRYTSCVTVLLFFNCGLFDGAFSISGYMSDDAMIKNEFNSIYYRRKWSWPKSRNYPGICQEGERKTTITSVRLAGIRAEI
jgi:hypothetical protein